MGGLETQSREYVVARGIHKHFGGVHALNDVSLSIERGTIHGLVGENGAGKSTFGKLVAGFYTPDGGQLIIDGEPVRFRSPVPSVPITKTSRGGNKEGALSTAEEGSGGPSGTPR